MKDSDMGREYSKHGTAVKFIYQIGLKPEE
jgi:hypothetical protein